MCHQVSLCTLTLMKLKIITGGQTGVDRAALDAALAAGLPYGGLIPKGRTAEDGPISASYDKLTESDRKEHPHRTEQNVLTSDATLILGFLPMTGGTHLTNEICHKHNKTHTFINLELPFSENERQILTWLGEVNPRILNIAGPRESKRPGVYKKARTLLENVFRKLSH